MPFFPPTLYVLLYKMVQHSALGMGSSGQCAGQLDPSLQRACAQWVIGVSINVEDGTPQDFRTHCEREARRNLSGRGSLETKLNHWVLHIFYWTHFPWKVSLIVSSYCILIRQRNKNTLQRVTKFVLSYAILMKPQSHYKISQINTALDHKHDMDSPLHPLFHQKLASSLLHHGFRYFGEHLKQIYSWINKHR